jgi:hypothetical protein
VIKILIHGITELISFCLNDIVVGLKLRFFFLFALFGSNGHGVCDEHHGSRVKICKCHAGYRGRSCGLPPVLLPRA